MSRGRVLTITVVLLSSLIGLWLFVRFVSLSRPSTSEQDAEVPALASSSSRAPDTGTITDPPSPAHALAESNINPTVSAMPGAKSDTDDSEKAIYSELLRRMQAAYNDVPVGIVVATTVDMTDPAHPVSLPDIKLERTNTGMLRLIQGEGFFADAAGIIDTLKFDDDFEWKVERNRFLEQTEVDVFSVAGEKGAMSLWVSEQGVVIRCDVFMSGQLVSSVSFVYERAPNGKYVQVKSTASFPVTGKVVVQSYSERSAP